MKRPSLKILFAVLALSLGMTSSLGAQTKASWIHVEVRENTTDPELVKVNLPFSMLETALKVVKDKHFEEGHFRLDTHEDITVADMRQLWNEVKKSGNAEFVTVQKAHESVKVAREGNYLVIKVSEAKNKTSNVDIKVPVSVVDALFSGSTNELDSKAALMALQQSGAGEFLTVHDNHSDVKIWID